MILPGEILWPVGSTGSIRIVPLVINGGCDFIDGGIEFPWAVPAVIEDKNIPFSWASRYDPLCVMRPEEFLVNGYPCTIGLRIAPSVQKIPSFVINTASVISCFLSCCTMIDDPKFTYMSATYDDLIKGRVIVKGVGMNPVFISIPCEIDIQ